MELKKIIETYKTVDFNKNKAAFATVVRVEGSSYRRAGAKMIIIDDGRWTGAISGGCLEGDALRKARQAIIKGSPSLVTYNTMKDKDAMSLGVGLGCNGIIDVLIEPIQADNPFQIAYVQNFLMHEEPAALATIYSLEKTDLGIGHRWLLLKDKFKDLNEGVGAENGWSEDFLNELFQDMKQAHDSFRSFNSEYNTPETGVVRVFIEFLRPQIHLIIFGGGYDAVPLVNLAKLTGWKATITDDCVAHMAPARFPAADHIVHAFRHEVVSKLPVNGYTAAVLLSHNYNYDFAVFKDLLKTNIPYIGILGPRKKFQKMKEQLAEENQYLNKEDEQRIFSPVGLDIGAELPEEIAVSIIAEIQAHFNNCSGIRLKEKAGPIHERTETIQVHTF